MLKLPTRNTHINHEIELPEITYFNNYNQDSFIECFQSFPTSSALYVMNSLIRFLSGNVKSTEIIKPHNLSINDIIFANYTIKDLEDDNAIDLEDMVSREKIKTFSIKFIDDIYFRFYYFDNYTFKMPIKYEKRNVIDRKFLDANQYHCYTMSYSLSSNLGTSRDVRIIDFFFDNNFEGTSLLGLFAKVIDSMIIEHLRRATNKMIPLNTMTHFAPAYIILPEFISIDGLDFAYNYLFTTFDLYNNVKFYMEFDGFAGDTTISNIIKIINDNNKLDNGIGLFYKDSYFEPLWKILTNKYDSHEILKELYLAYRKEMLNE